MDKKDEDRSSGLSTVPEEAASATTMIFKDDQILGQFCYMSREKLHRESHRYVDWVNSTLANHTAPSIDCFSVCFELDRRFTSSIDDWVQFAMKKSVRELVLDLVLTRSNIYKDSYAFPHKILGLCDPSTPPFRPKLPRLIFLCPQCNRTDGKECAECTDSPPCQECLCPSDSIGSDVTYLAGLGFQSLEVVQFVNIDLNDEVMDYFLSNCPNLQRLLVSRTTNLRRVRVKDNAVLKHLEIKNCLFIKSIDIVDSVLESFIYQGHLIELCLQNVPSLVTVCLNQTDLLTDDMWTVTVNQLSSYLNQLETLMLDIRYHGPTIYSREHVYAKPPLPNLKNLELIVLADDFYSLLRLDTFLEMSPNLQRLVLKLEYYPTKYPMIKGVAHKHDLLEVVEIQGYRACENAVEHVMYLVENAVGLRQIILDPTKRSMTHPSGAEKSIHEIEEEVKAREHAHKLKETMPPSIEVIVCR